MHNNLLLANPAGDEKLYVEDVFSTWLYTGNGSTQTITNGIDLAGKGGLVWIKSRSGAYFHSLTDTARGAANALYTNSPLAQNGDGNSAVNPFLSSGFTLNSANISENQSGQTYASWTFRKAPKFFDVVTYTGSGASGKVINHSLGVAPGMIILKRTDTTAAWIVWHRTFNGSQYLLLNDTSSILSDAPTVNFSNVGASSFQIDSTWGSTNASGGSYVAYLFAHDTTADGVIQCGTFSASSATTVNLGWEPQYVLLKQSSGAQSWYVVDTMRNLSFTAFPFLQPNTVDAETDAGVVIEPTPTGFTFKGANLGMTGGQTYVYMAIRRGPMRVPTDATKVFTPAISGTNNTPAYTTSYPPDMLFSKWPGGSGAWQWADRLRGNKELSSNTTAAETTNNYVTMYQNGAFSLYWSSYKGWAFRRAPGFFDVVCYTGTGNQTTRSHGLKAIPELIIVKSRSFNGGNGNWYVYHSALSDKAILLNSASSAFSSPLFAYGNHTDTYFSVLSNMDSYVGVNDSGQPYVAYLFASCPGVSKVGTYTGNGSSLNIDCGFTNGARFVLIKQSNGYTDWYVWDTARGIVAANDPHLSLNNTNTEVTTNDSIDPLSSGFTVNQDATTNINASGGTYIYLAIA